MYYAKIHGTSEIYGSINRIPGYSNLNASTVFILVPHLSIFSSAFFNPLK